MAKKDKYVRYLEKTDKSLALTRKESEKAEKMGILSEDLKKTQTEIKKLESKIMSGKSVKVNIPARTIELSLKNVNVKDIRFSDPHPPDLYRRVNWFIDMYRAGKPIPPILVHRLPDGSYEVIDGHARLGAYQRLGVKNIPVVENGLADIARRLGKGVQSARELKTSYNIGKEERVQERVIEQGIRIKAARFRQLRRMAEHGNEEQRTLALRQVRDEFPEELKIAEGME